MAFQFDLAKIQWVKGHRNMPEAHYVFKVPSVTAILGEIPDPDFDAFVAAVGKEKADQIMNAAGQRGSAMHTFLENFISKYSSNKDISEALKFTQEESVKSLLEEKIPEDKIDIGRNLFYKFYYSDYSTKYIDVLAMELPIFSPTYFYRGKLDILFKDKLFGLAVTDFKSSAAKIKKGSVKEYKYNLQLGAYANAIDEMYKSKGIIINYASILCIDKQHDALEEISSSGAELAKHKEEFKTLCKEWHIKYNQEFLIA